MTPEEKLKEILDSGPFLSELKEWREVESILMIGELPGIISKMEIDQYDLYIKTAWLKGNVARIDITLSRGHDSSDELPRSEQQASLEATRFDLARSWIEGECRMASHLLQTGNVGMGVILEEWIGAEGYPSGLCPQIVGVNPQTGERGPTFVKGPLHAAGMLIRRRLVQWTEMMR
jgi:hypothetical protein